MYSRPGGICATPENKKAGDSPSVQPGERGDDPSTSLPGYWCDFSRALQPPGCGASRSPSPPLQAKGSELAGAGSRDCPNPCVQLTCLKLAPRDARDEGDRDGTHALCDSSHHVCRCGASRAEETATFPQLGLGRSPGASGLSREVVASCSLCKAGALGEKDDQGSLTAARPRCLHHPGAH